MPFIGSLDVLKAILFFSDVNCSLTRTNKIFVKFLLYDSIALFLYLNICDNPTIPTDLSSQIVKSTEESSTKQSIIVCSLKLTSLEMKNGQ